MLLRRIHSLYGVFLFLGLYALMFPAFFILVQKEKWHRIAIRFNRLWAKAFYKLLFIPYKLEGTEHIDPKKQYILCPNHTSYLDIPTMGLAPINFKFVGKRSLAKVPLFGYMYKKLHITIDRNSFRDRFQSFDKAKHATSSGFNLVVFPEGGIRATNPPNMASFKDGPFRLAIEQQIPIIPVTIPYNWILLPDDNRFLLKWFKTMVIFHEPIETKGLEKDDINSLKQQVFRVIDKELNKFFPKTTKV